MPGTGTGTGTGTGMGTGTQTANGNGFLIECTIKCEMHFTARKQTTRIKGRMKKKNEENKQKLPRSGV